MIRVFLCPIHILGNGLKKHETALTTAQIYRARAIDISKVPLSFISWRIKTINKRMKVIPPHCWIKVKAMPFQWVRLYFLLKYRS